MNNYNFRHKKKSAALIISADNERDAREILGDIVSLPFLWILDDMMESDNVSNHEISNCRKVNIPL